MENNDSGFKVWVKKMKANMFLAFIMYQVVVIYIYSSKYFLYILSILTDNFNLWLWENVFSSFCNLVNSSTEKMLPEHNIHALNTFMLSCLIIM